MTSRPIAGVASGMLMLVMAATVEAAEFDGSWKGTLTGADGSAAEVQIDFGPQGFPMYSYTNSKRVTRQVELSHFRDIIRISDVRTDRRSSFLAASGHSQMSWLRGRHMAEARKFCFLDLTPNHQLSCPSRYMGPSLLITLLSATISLNSLRSDSCALAPFGPRN